jgi:dihydroorotase
MVPPLRTEEDLKELWKGLADGTIDAIASDHAPHAANEKEDAFCSAPNGIIGLETLLPLGLRLVESGKLSLATLIERMSVGPARILGIDAGTLVSGEAADLVLFDPEASLCIDMAFIRSKSKNTPFFGWIEKGRVMMTLVGGQVKYRYR